MGFDRVEQSFVGQARIAEAKLSERRAFLAEDFTDG
ncbi:hypothetical protein BTHI11S_04736 [Bosea thiooxidans]